MSQLRLLSARKLLIGLKAGSEVKMEFVAGHLVRMSEVVIAFEKAGSEVLTVFAGEQFAGRVTG